MARALAGEGCDVAICSRDPDGVAAAGERIREETGATVEALAADLSRPGGPEDFAREATARLGVPHVLVLNTGGPPAANFGQTEDTDWQSAYELLLRPVQALLRVCVPGMKERGYGRVLAVTSVAVKAPIGHLVLSNSLRAGVAGLMKTLSRELGSDGITVNTLCPGYHLTDRLKDLARTEAARSGTDPGDVLKEMAARVPLGSLGDPAGFAALAAFLASPVSDYTTGTMIQVDGGLYEGLV